LCKTDQLNLIESSHLNNLLSCQRQVDCQMECGSHVTLLLQSQCTQEKKCWKC